MKKKVALICAGWMMALGPCGAQVLGVLDVLPLPGDSFRYHGVTDAALFDAGLAGFGVTWDQSGLVLITGNYAQLTWVDPPAAPHIASYPSSDVVLNRTIGLDPTYYNFFYYDHEQEGLFHVGTVGDILSYDYDIPELENTLPLAAGSPSVHDFCYTSSGLGQTSHYCGETSEELDGAGTLVLPYGTFNNVLRTTYQRYHVEDAAPSDTSFALFHRWWVPGMRRPILEEYRFTGTNGVTLVDVDVMNESFALGITEAATSRVRFFPAPFQESLVIELVEPVRRSGGLEVFTSDGRLCHASALPPGTARHQVDGTSLPIGPLLVQVATDENRFAKTVIHQR
ncbi:MAG: hypothetical protein KA175_05750 [Flavobacteriales bacterium]|nr:hypothetical protein [Flavobacteriales bacterium]MBP6697101.1 hypothetical protein [Flavobacteriales bacterium]